MKLSIINHKIFLVVSAILCYYKYIFHTITKYIWSDNMGKAKSNTAPVAAGTLKWQENFERITANIISVMVFVAFGFVALMRDRKSVV